MYAKGLGVPQNDAQAVAWFRKAAKQGDAGAQNNLGTMYRDGRGVSQDYAQAVAWFGKAAKQGDAGAQNNLEEMCKKGYNDGLDASKRGNYEAAARLWRPLAEQGYARAQAGLGRMYANGQGLPQNDAQAVEWLRKAAKKGDVDAQSDLRKMYQWFRRRAGLHERIQSKPNNKEGETHDDN